jgi:hypothetical protein
MFGGAPANDDTPSMPEWPGAPQRRNLAAMRHAYLLLALPALLAACSPAPVEKAPLTPPGDAAGAAVVRRAVPEPSPPPPAEAPVTVPPGALYACVSDTDGVRQTTAIEFAPKVGALCARTPEMGPCQYERNVCRRSGGRVYAANGDEITLQTEAEYDKKVMRVRFKSN